MSILRKSKRHRVVMLAILHHYIESAEPVGSKNLVKRYNLDLSPATVRGVMADLEESGYLMQPHTSAGRVPTESAYRYYVDEILMARALSTLHVDRVKTELAEYQGSVGELARKASRVLSDFSSYTGIVLAPQRLKSTFKRVSFIRIKSRVVLVVLVSLSGITENRLVNVDQDYSQDALDKMSRYLNDRYRGFSLLQMRKRIAEDMRKDKENYDLLMNAAFELGKKALDSDEDQDIYVEGSSNILDFPEFTMNIEHMRQLFKTFEEKSNLVALLDEAMNAEGLSVFIGSEIGIAGIHEVSLVTSTYGDGVSTLGTVGIIGPSRMNYSAVIPLVQTTASSLSENLTKEEL